MSITTDLLTRSIERVLTEHKRGAVYRDGLYHCRCGWVSPNRTTNATVTADHHRARMIAEAIEKEWA